MNSKASHIVRLIGSDRIDHIECGSFQEARAKLKEAFESTIASHDGGSWFDEIYYVDDECANEFQVAGDEFFQSGVIIPANNQTGSMHTIQQIVEAADEVDTYANCYEYELQDMQGVFEKTAEIKKLCDKLKNEIRADGNAGASYVKTIRKMLTDVEGDSTIPQDVRARVSVLLKQLDAIFTVFCVNKKVP